MSKQLYTIKQAATLLRRMAEATAAHSKNWDNFEGICTDMLKACDKSARKIAKDAASSDTGE